MIISQLSFALSSKYALLPENHFPVALDQISAIYTSLTNGDAKSILGFDINRICVTGESAGGNLAAGLCCRLSHESSNKRLPDGLMLSCPALNLTTELSLSRIIGTEDPVLPNALLTAISEAYLPSQQGYDKKDPLASPFFASDSTLSCFPPTLIFASSSDPLLDDSVVFNERLCALGVRSEIKAVHNVPHAYLGLGTAGFPEAVQVQNYAMDWLKERLQS